jgi:peptide/nickel transport system permease protein
MSARIETIGAHERLPTLLWRTLSGRIGIVIVAVFLLTAMTAPVLAPYDPLASDWLNVLQAPSAAHLLGTDDLGRDVLSRLLWGAQSSMFAAFVAVALALLVGVPPGIVAGYFGGLLDLVIMRITDTLLAVPGIILAIALALFLGGSLVNATLAIAVAAVPAFIRLARARTLQIRAELYIEAARSVGLPNSRLLFIHVLPNLMPPIIVQATLAMAIAVISEASLSFLGLGRPPPEPSWGTMLTVAKDYIATAPWLSVWPGLCIFLATLGFALLGDGLSQSLERR